MICTTEAQSEIVGFAFAGQTAAASEPWVGKVTAPADGDLVIEIPDVASCARLAGGALQLKMKQPTFDGKYTVGLEIPLEGFTALFEVGSAKIIGSDVSIMLNGPLPFDGKLRVRCGISSRMKPPSERIS